jgi:hypothetical protein
MLQLIPDLIWSVEMGHIGQTCEFTRVSCVGRLRGGGPKGETGITPSLINPLLFDEQLLYKEQNSLVWTAKSLMPFGTYFYVEIITTIHLLAHIKALAIVLSLTYEQFPSRLPHFILQVFRCLSFSGRLPELISQITSTSGAPML